MVKKTLELPPLEKNHFRLSVKSQPSRVIQTGIYKFRKEEDTDTLYYSACGGAISNLIVVVEVLKHRIPGLHQTNKLRCIKVEDTYEPKEEGLDTVVLERFITLLEIVLSTKEPEEHDPIGY